MAEVINITIWSQATDNPIEHLWPAFNTRLRKDLAAAANLFPFITNMCLWYCQLILKT
jgi:hypothetical protein